MMRSVGAVAAGWLVFKASALIFFGLSGHAPGEAPTAVFAIVSLCEGLVSAVAAGWVTARLAPRNGTSHAVVLAAVIALVALVSFFFASGIKWSQMLTMFIVAPAAIGGGMLRARPGKPLTS